MSGTTLRLPCLAAGSCISQLHVTSRETHSVRVNSNRSYVTNPVKSQQKQCAVRCSKRCIVKSALAVDEARSCRRCKVRGIVVHSISSIAASTVADRGIYTEVWKVLAFWGALRVLHLHASDATQTPKSRMSNDSAPPYTDSPSSYEVRG